MTVKIIIYGENSNMPLSKLSGLIKALKETQSKLSINEFDVEFYIGMPVNDKNPDD
jgi:hypothetical protein